MILSSVRVIGINILFISPEPRTLPDIKMLRVCWLIKGINEGLEMAPQPTELAIFQRNSAVIPSTDMVPHHMVIVIGVCNSSSRAYDALLWPP